jgi:hypothetical protein
VAGLRSPGPAAPADAGAAPAKFAFEAVGSELICLLSFGRLLFFG